MRVPPKQYLQELQQRLTPYNTYILSYVRLSKQNEPTTEQAFFEIFVLTDLGKFISIARTTAQPLLTTDQEILQQARKVIDLYKLPPKKAKIGKFIDYPGLEKIIEETKTSP